MDFGLAAEEKALTEAFSQTLARVCSTARLRVWEAERVSFDAAFLTALSQGGFLEAGLPWSDCPSFSVLVQLEEVAGRFLAPPLLSWQSAYAAFLLGDHPLALRISAGELVAPLVPGRGHVSLQGNALTGAAEGVPFLDHSQYLLAVVGDVAALVPAPPQRENAELVETQSLVPQWRTTFDGAAAEVVRVTNLGLGLTRLRTGLAAWSTGAGARAVELAAAYAREREQFGHPIGSYQSVQNRLVDAAVQIEQARMLVYRAAALVDAGEAEADQLAVLARHQAGKAFVQASRAALLTHGGYGFTVDFDVQLYFRRAKEAQLAFEPRVEWPLAPAFRGGR